MEDDPDRKKSVSGRGLVGAFVWLMLVFVGAGTVFGFFGSLWWGFDLFAHFRGHYVLALLVVVVAALLVRRRILAVVALAGFAVNAVLVLPVWIGSGVPEPHGFEIKGNTLTVVQFNVFTHNKQKDEVFAWLRDQQARLVVLQEVDAGWIAAAESGLEGFRMLDSAVARDDNFGMAVFVRDGLRIEEATRFWDSAQVPRLETTVRLAGGATVRVIAVHTLPPVSAGYAAERGEQFDALGQRVRAAEGEGHQVVVIGDLNATPWSAPFRQLIQETGLRDTAVGFGPSGTWPTPAGWLLGIPLDHVLVGPEVTLLARWIGPSLGSDHRPVAAELVMPRSPGSAVDAED